MNTTKILVIDDDEVIHTLLEKALTDEGYMYISAYCHEDAYDKIRTQNPDLVVLDLMLPGEDGVQICRNINIRHLSNIPIIFITSKNSLFDMAMCFGAGGDDFVTKPFSRDELIMRIKTHLRRYRELVTSKNNDNITGIFMCQDLTINLNEMTVSRGNIDLHLTAKEFKLLAALAQKPNTYLSTTTLVELVWYNTNSSDTRSFMAHMSKLRKKLGDSPSKSEYITSLRNMGYKLNTIEN